MKDELEKPGLSPEHQALVENSQRLIRKTKELVTDLEADIEKQEKILAKQRIELRNLLKELGVEEN